MEGYDHMCSDMVKYPELAIFRKFKILNYRTLLFLQAELTHKEDRLLAAIRADRNSGDPERRQFAFSFEAMLRSKSDIEGARAQRKLMREICRLAKDYSTWLPSSKIPHELLLQNRELDDLPPVHKPSLACLRAAQVSVSDRRLFLRGRELHTWSKRKEYDLTSLTDQKANRDPLSSWLEWFITNVFHKFSGSVHYNPDPVDEDWAPATPTKLVQYPQRHISRSVTAVTTILAPVLPTVSASALFFIDNELTRLGIIVLLSFLFSIALACVGVPRRIDSFVATATFTAVLIVFIGNNSSCAC
ncbi:uncharacterized protein Z519_11875 [Cladophialophora bantiana CBS 173.52]|uniref:DUF6594 domain-containing protein n=1 Tax=Cladophialophora bantiana (strain ATCC 10958 / CBS 173.52 / CDC B-1940 / NIH 8579) TaxID=1442370 RepID=A0A0D2EBU6_CLAB1|nr:uncharacterized protein Z519_11875 [Cladophialophora bantiana CBS 173.52]KIW87551.1 hypothetical protein Z519_11875 [Cladophialophora bantiana CBS 173.52]